MGFKGILNIFFFIDDGSILFVLITIYLIFVNKHVVVELLYIGILFLKMPSLLVTSGKK